LKTALKTILLLVLLVITWSLRVYHLAVLTPPIVGESHAQATWIDKSKYGIHQLVLQGAAFGRGLKAGALTEKLLRLQEQDLTTQLFSMIPEPMVKILEIPLIRYFWGIENFVDPWMLEEMYGVSQSAPKEFDELIDGYSRQLAYHGLHEVGQMMVDQGGDDMGCTVVAAPIGKSWVLGRNFDFEGGRILDREKVLKWVFPDNGYAFVSVIWAGMVGGVTAVNEHGLYLSINAAGSAEGRRYGMPTTLLLVKTLMGAKDAAEAIQILKSQPTFITDIFVLLDTKTGELFRIEKSPQITEVIPLKGPSVVVNHLISPHFANDRVNVFRREQLTSVFRGERAKKLLKDPVFKTAKRSRDLELPILKIIRDKGADKNGKPLTLGNRRAIDALIATHSVVYNSDEQILFVSQGPALSGAFTGFDLKKSFAERRPVFARNLPRDNVTEEQFDQVHVTNKMLKAVNASILHGRCDEALVGLKTIPMANSFSYFEAMGDYESHCQNRRENAAKYWQQAMDLQPAYPREVARIKKKLSEAVK
jgi:hypothetical protein